LDGKLKEVKADEVVDAKYYLVRGAGMHLVYWHDGLCYGFKGGHRMIAPCQFESIYEVILP